MAVDRSGAANAARTQGNHSLSPLIFLDASPHMTAASDHRVAFQIPTSRRWHITERLDDALSNVECRDPVGCNAVMVAANRRVGPPSELTGTWPGIWTATW